MLCGGCLAAASLASTQKGQHHQQRSPRHATRASPDSAKWSPSVGAYEAVPLPPGLTTSLMALVGLLQTLVSDGKVLQNRESRDTSSICLALLPAAWGEAEPGRGRVGPWRPRAVIRALVFQASFIRRGNTVKACLGWWELRRCFSLQAFGSSSNDLLIIHYYLS